MDEQNQNNSGGVSFFDRPGVNIDTIPIGSGIQIGIEKIANPAVGIGGAYGTWGIAYDNRALPSVIEAALGEPLADNERMNLDELGFLNRCHTGKLTEEEHIAVEVEVGARFLRSAAEACGWEPGEVEGVLIGTSTPTLTDYTERIARLAGIPEEAIKVSVHKACDGSVGGLHAALNPRLAELSSWGRNLAEELQGKKILVGGIEGLSRFLNRSRDKNAFQLFGNGAGIVGVIPGKTMKFLVGKMDEVFDEEGVLQVMMTYPHSRHKTQDQSLLEVTEENEHHIRLAGMMHEPADGSSVIMAGPMGMVKLFVRSGVQVVQDVYRAYLDLIDKLNMPDKSITVAIVHHANYKINKLKEKNLEKLGIHLSMPWLLTEFGNVSAASNMIAFLRKLPDLRPSDHVLFDGFGAGTYYDAFVVELGGSS